MPEPRTTWRDIARDLRAAIERGEYEPGARLPSRSSLMRQYGVAPQTVVNAINSLRNEGLVIGLTGSGWYVRGRQPLLRSARIEQDDTGPGGVYAQLESAGLVLSHFTEAVRVGQASESEAERLDVPVGAAVFRIRRTAHTPERPVEVNVITATGDTFELVYELPAE